MKKKQNRHSFTHPSKRSAVYFARHFSVLLGVSVIAVSVLMKMFLDIATNAKHYAAHHMSHHRGRRFARARHLAGRYVRFAGQAFLPHGAFSAQRHGGAPIPHRP